MKNMILKFTAAALSVLMFTACSKKTEDNPEAPEAPAVEHPFLELSEADFKEITIPVTISDDPSPVELKCLDVSEFDFGERISPCKTDESDIADRRSKDMSFNDAFYEYFKITPMKGLVINFVKDGNSLYITVNYDLYCYGHELSVFRYDLDTEEMNEIYRHSDTEACPFYHNTYLIMNGKNYYSADDGIRAYDFETAEDSLVYESENNAYCSGIYNGRLYIEEFVSSDDGETIVVSSFDPESGEITELYSGAKKALKSYCCNDICAVMVKPEDSRLLTVQTDHYTIDTKFTNGEILYASPERLIVLTDETLHTYDVEKKEHYITKADEIGSFFECKDGAVFSACAYGGDSPVYYFMPDIGFAFRLTEPADYQIPQLINNTIITEETQSFVVTVDNGSYGTHDCCKLYWFD